MAVSKTKNKIGKIRFEKKQVPVCWLAAGVAFAFAAGGIAGWARYWYGYFVLGQGVLAGLFIPWAATVFCARFFQEGKKTKKPGSLILVLIFFVCFMIAQAIFYGLAQPWFAPVGWLVRVLQHRTNEVVWGISLLGGAVARNFQMGINGGFWIFLNIFDLFFMCFFLLVGINIQMEGKK